MGFIFDILIDILFAESKNKKVSKPKRYLSITLLALFFIFLVGLIVFTGIELLEDNLVSGIITLVLGLMLLIVVIIEFRISYIKKTK